MKRRTFHAAAASLAVLGSTPLWAQTGRFQAGKEYIEIEPVATEPGVIEVVDFFWYGCPHCNDFEPQLAAWSRQLPSDVRVRHVPVAFRREFEAHQKLYYAIEAMGKVDELHPKVFAAFHKERRRINDAKAVGEFAKANGVDDAELVRQFNSFSVNAKARQASQLVQSYKIEGVPTLGVDGRYLTSAVQSGSHQRTLMVADYLIEEVRRKRKS